MEKVSLLHEDAEKPLLDEEQRTKHFEKNALNDGIKCKEDDKPNKKRRFFEIPKRYILCFLVFWGFLLMNCERSCLSVAIVAMSAKRKVKIDGKWVTKVIFLVLIKFSLQFFPTGFVLSSYSQIMRFEDPFCQKSSSKIDIKNSQKNLHGGF